MLAPWLTLAASLLAASPHLRLDTALEATTGASGAPALASGNLELEPSLSARVHLRAGKLKARYAPRLLLSGAMPGQVAGVCHLLSLEGEWRLDPGLLLYAAQRLLYGRSDSVRPQPRPWETFDMQEGAALAAEEMWTLAEAGFFLAASRRLTLTGSLMHSAHGPTLASAGPPLKHGPSLHLSASYDATRNDVLRSSLYASHVFLTGGGSSSVLQLTGGWKRQLTRTSRAALDFGGSVACEGRSDCRDILALLPVLIGELTQELPRRTQRVELGLVAGMESYEGYSNGALHERLGAGGTLTWVFRERLRLRGRVTTAWDVPLRGGPAVWLGVLELGAGYAFGPRFVLQAGAQARWQLPPDSATGETFHWTTFASVIVTTEDSRYDP